jgi:uncharacterized pyridoxamine 5'-phosphate oxidase family protein
MVLTEAQQIFLENNHSAAMITVGKDGKPKVARVGTALVDGRLWSSGTEERKRTARLRRDPRCTLFVFDAAWRWLTLETAVRILDGADMPSLQLKMFRQMQNRPTGDLSWLGKELSEAEFLSVMEQEHRLIYEFEILHAYGMV